MSSLQDEFNEILQRDVPLADHTWLKLGGPADYLITPRDRDELVQVVRACHDGNVPVKILGAGSNVFVSDDGFRGAVIKVVEPLLGSISIDGTKVTAEGGALLSHVVSESVRAGLAGIETLVGIPGTLGGAIAGNSGGRHGDIGEVLTKVTVCSTDGTVTERTGDELTFSYRHSSINDLLILSAELQLREDDTDELTQRMKKTWIMKRSTQPLADQSAGCIFRNPRGLSAGALIEQCGLKGLASGNASISDRHANFIVTQPGASGDDIQQLIDRVRSAVSEKFGVDLELEIQKW